MKEAFLHFLAKNYIKDTKLSTYCFIFPNRRSGTFFAKELHDSAKEATLSPEITTISNFVSTITNSIEANRIESLFALFDAYKELVPNNTASFDKFVHWGDIILNDFSDVDRDCVNAKDLFINISELKSIKANYLSPETMETLCHFFNLPYNLSNIGHNDDSLWQHISAQDGNVEIKKKFVSIWDVLYQLYCKFNEKLEKAGLTYNGKMFRQATDIIKEKDVNGFNSSKYIFIGFNVLSASEKKIFRAMKEKGIAEFHWDYNSPAFISPRNKGTKFLSQYTKEFPPPFTEERNDGFPKNITAVGVPSNYGQARYAQEIVSHLVLTHEIADSSNAIDTAIVLPDEDLFMPLLKSGNNDIQNINVTMGLSIKNSSIATLMSAISRLHYQAKTVKGELKYFHADIKDILLHPIVKHQHHDEAQNLIDYIIKNNLYQVSYNDIEKHAPNLKTLFTIVSNDPNDVIKYIKGILEFTEKVLRQQLNMTPSEEIDDYDSNPQNTASVEIAFLDKYREGLEQIIDSVEAQIDARNDNFKITTNTFCFLLDRLLSTSTIPFEGEPLGGLQIMGILETRCLDFKNVIILSMNERIFPRKHFNKSFIPSNMRAAFKMATVEHQEAMYAYYFYRLISRAENVYMLFDSRTQGGKSGEESRFIHQLDTLYNHKCKVKRIMLRLGIEAPSKQTISVEKDDRIMDILNRYKRTIPENKQERDEARKNGNLKMLSAHSINMFIDCPLRFYLRYIEGLPEIDEMSEFMEASTFGTIVHETMQDLYKDGSTIDTSFIDSLLNDSNKTIGDTIKKKINEHFLLRGKDCTKDLFGESLLKYDIIYEFIRRVLVYDKKMIIDSGHPIQFIQAEKELACQVTAGNHTFNLQYTIDRLDSVTENDGTTYKRIVDYKTGKDNVSVDKVSRLFNSKSSNRAHAILQLLLYCNAYRTSEDPNGEAIKPIIYKITNMLDSGIKINRKQYILPSSGELSDDIINNEFMNELSNVINRIFNRDTPFTQADNEGNCKYCKFKDFCRKE